MEQRIKSCWTNAPELRSTRPPVSSSVLNAHHSAIAIRSTVPMRLSRSIQLSLASFAFAVIAFAVTPAHAQGEWSEIRDHENPPTARQAIPAMRRRGITDAAVFDDHYYFRFEQFTHAESRNELADFRGALKNELKGATDKNAHDRINDIALEVLAEIASSDEYAPAARFNAVLMLGDLNEVESVIGGGPAVPLPAGADALLQVWTTLQGQVDGVSDALRLAVLKGVENHLSGNSLASDAEQSRVAEILTAIAAANDPPDGRTANTHSFFRTRAADILGQLGKSGPDRGSASSLDALVKMVADQDAPFYMRAAAADAIGKLDLSEPAGMDYSDIARVLGDFAHDAATSDEKPRAKMSYLYAVQVALDGDGGNNDAVALAAVDSGEVHKPIIEEFKLKIEEMVDALDDRRATEEEMQENLEMKTKELAAWLEGRDDEIRLLPNLEVIQLTSAAEE